MIKTISRNHSSGKELALKLLLTLELCQLFPLNISIISHEKYFMRDLVKVCNNSTKVELFCYLCQLKLGKEHRNWLEVIIMDSLKDVAYTDSEKKPTLKVSPQPAGRFKEGRILILQRLT